MSLDINGAKKRLRKLFVLQQIYIDLKEGRTKRSEIPNIKRKLTLWKKDFSTVGLTVIENIREALIDYEKKTTNYKILVSTSGL